MLRMREVRKYGGTHMIPLFKADVIDFDISEGDLVDISKIKFIKPDEEDLKNE